MKLIIMSQTIAHLAKSEKGVGQLVKMKMVASNELYTEFQYNT